MSGTLNATLNSTPAGQAAAVNFNIPYIVPPNTPPNLAPYLQPIYSDFQNLIQTLILNAGISARTPAQMLTSKDDPTAYLAANTHRFYTQALEPIVYGAPISLVSIGNITYVRNAWAKDTTLPPHGFCSNSGGIKSGSIGEVCIGDGMIVNTFNNLTVGSIYYVSNNAGNYSATPGTNNYPVGYAITSTSLLFRAFNGLDGPPKQDTYLLATQYYTEAPGSSSIFNRAPPPTPLSTLSNMTVGDKDKLKNIFNFGEVWAPDQNYECSAKLQSFLLYCQMMALAQKNLSGDNNCYRQYVTCYIPRGQYLLGSPVVIPELVKVDGPGIFERVGYLGAQSGVLTNGLFYATSTSGQPGCYRPMMICVPRAHIGLLNLYTGNTNYYFRGPGLVIGKYWSIDTTSIVNIGNAGSGYAVNDTITAVNPSVSPYFGCTVKVTSVTTGGAITGLTATNCGAYGLPPNLQIQQWTTANGFNVFDPANPGYFIQGSTSGSGSGCSFLPTWCSEFAGGNYNFGAYHQGSPLQTDTIVEHVNITGSMPGTIDSTYGPQYCVMVTGLNGIIHEIEGIGGHIGCYFLFANDYRVTHLNFVLSGIFCQIYSCGSIEIVDPIPDTCGCQLMIDQSGRIKATLMQFVEEANLPGGPVYPNTQGYAICIGSSSSATYCNQHLDIKFMLVNSGAVTSATLTEYPNLATIGNIVKPQNASIYLAYVKDSNIEGVVGNWDETGQYTS